MIKIIKIILIVIGLLLLSLYILEPIHIQGRYQKIRNISAQSTSIDETKFTKHTFGDLEISIPNEFEITSTSSDSKVFLDKKTSKQIIVALFGLEPEGLDFSGYEFMKKTYYPGLDFIANIWHKKFLTAWNNIESMDRIRFKNYIAFTLKATPKDSNFPVTSYQIFDAKMKHFVCGVVFMEQQISWNENEQLTIIQNIKLKE